MREYLFHGLLILVILLNINKLFNIKYHIIMIIFKISNQKLMNLMVLYIYFSEYKHNTLPMALDVIQNSKMLYLYQYGQNSAFH